jgi:hypothetical protein
MRSVSGCTAARSSGNGRGALSTCWRTRPAGVGTAADASGRCRYRGADASERRSRQRADRTGLRARGRGRGRAVCQPARSYECVERKKLITVWM